MSPDLPIIHTKASSKFDQPLVKSKLIKFVNLASEGDMCVRNKFSVLIAASELRIQVSSSSCVRTFERASSKITFRRRRRNIWKTTIPPQIKVATIPPLSPAIKVTEVVEFVLAGPSALVAVDAEVTDVVTDVMTDVMTDVVIDIEVIGVLAAVTPAPGEEEHVDRLQVQE